MTLEDAKKQTNKTLGFHPVAFAKYAFACLGEAGQMNLVSAMRCRSEKFDEKMLDEVTWAARGERDGNLAEMQRRSEWALFALAESQWWEEAANALAAMSTKK